VECQAGVVQGLAGVARGMSRRVEQYINIKSNDIANQI
jgi:hypothetical protein